MSSCKVDTSRRGPFRGERGKRPTSIEENVKRVVSLRRAGFSTVDGFREQSRVGTSLGWSTGALERYSRLRRKRRLGNRLPFTVALAKLNICCIDASVDEGDRGLIAEVSLSLSPVYHGRNDIVPRRRTRRLSAIYDLYEKTELIVRWR